MTKSDAQTTKCACLDGAYSHCDICSPPLEADWLYKSMQEVKRQVDSWPKWMKNVMGVEYAE